MKQATPEIASQAASQGAIMFVHGYMDGPQVWQRTIEELSLPGWDMLVCHLAPAGAAGASSEATLDCYAQQVLALLDAALPTPRRVVLVGHSMGGQVAELAARQWQGQLAGLVLITPAPLAGTPLPPEVMERFRSRIGLADPVAIGQGKRALGIGLDDDAVDVLVRSTLATGSDTALEQLQAWTGGHAAGAQASAVQAPVLTIATDDRFFTVEMLEHNATRFQRSSVKKIAGAGHWPQLEQPEALAHALEAFVRDLPAQD
jgi:pimeloyl-ACP methyl ester carboxylesterase